MSTLDNGLRLVVEQVPLARSVAVVVHYDVGFRSEPVGRSGFAHLFEHLMFQGSASIDRLAHHGLVQASGGAANGSTHQDYTDFYQVVPPAALERTLFLEADRMRALRLTPEGLAGQLAVVREEIRQNVHDRPYGGFPWTVLPGVLYRTWANGHDGYGSWADLGAAGLDECQDFYDHFYRPDNAVLTVCGQLDPDEVRRLVDRHFADLPAGGRPPTTELAEPAPAAERRSELRHPHTPVPALAVGWQLPDPVRALPDYLAAMVTERVLGGSGCSRLDRSLVQDAAVALEVSTGCGLFGPLDARAPDTALVVAMHRADQPVEEILGRLDEELAALALAGPDPDELRRSQAAARSANARRCDALMPRARARGTTELLFGDAGLLTRLPDLLDAVAAEDVARAAGWLRPDNRAVLALTAGTPDGGAGGYAGAAVHPPSPPSSTPGPGRVPQPGRKHPGRSAEPRPVPALGTDHPFELPPHRDVVLSNGQRVIAVRLPTAPMVEFRLDLPHQVHSDHAAAVAEVWAATLLRSGGTMPGDRIERALADHGASMAVLRHARGTCIGGSVPAAELGLVTDVLRDVLLHPRHDPAQVHRETSRLIERLTVQRSAPRSLADTALLAHCWPGIAGLTDTPSAGHVAAVAVEDVRRAAGRLAECDGSVLVLVGDLDLDRVIGQVVEALAGWDPGSPAGRTSLPPPVTGPLGTIDRPGAAQSQLRLLGSGVGRDDARFAALTVANLVFGGYFSSRLTRQVREDRGLAYRAEAGFRDVADRLVVAVEVDTATDATGEALAAVRAELDRMVTEPPTEGEVGAAVEYLVGMSRYALGSQASLTREVANIVGVGSDPGWLVSFPRRLAEVTTADVVSVARSVYGADRFTGVVLGDLTRVQLHGTSDGPHRNAQDNRKAETP